ncbi:protein kinase [Archangium violaceum]|uniref:protein kinase domain-containing protein n=1 Tax=Archangium violaceum TaxID=83451 RepID=UPI0036DCAC31
MSDAFDSELRMAVAEGLLSREEAEALRQEALRLGRPPLELLVERGRLSPDSLASLREERQEQARNMLNPADDTVTVQRPSGELPALEAAEFPVPGWERYQFVRLLGQGGMGQVFLAHDPRLRRDIALKFVRGDDPDAARRFVFEARAQARVVHERVCQVYEVGEVQGRPFIAMQYIDGQPLNQLARELSPEQKALVLRDAAEGVHAAHRAGLVHRDLKPSNIMVERTRDGSLEPYVMDFGLARDWKEGVTASGSVLGTPHYMAPEQARGEVTRLDRRADVYSLGATLYHLLTGTYPIQGSNHLEVLSNIPTEEPRPLRALDKDIPEDLEAIVLKCLEKERSARYDSARALAEDLDRFLNGEPVLARPRGPWYRLRKKVRQHRGAVALGSVALVLVALALGQAFLARQELASRERLTRRFTERVKDIESHALRSHLSPPHDIRPDQETIRTWMHELEAWMREAGTPAEGPGHYALGQGSLALGDERTARRHLETAWERGYREPQAAYALALVLGHLYQEQLLELERDHQQQRAKADPSDTSLQQQHEARRRELEQRLRDPALAYLRNSEGAPVPTSYVAALLAFYEGRFADALVHLDACGEGPPGFSAAPRLRGDIFLALATRQWDRGGAEQARASFAASRRAYTRAVDIGRSDPTLHSALARLEYAVMELELSSSGHVEDALHRGLQAVARALTVAPGHYESRILEARFHRRFAAYREGRSEEVLEPLHRALEAARTALRLAPERPEARVELGSVFWQRAQNHQAHKQDPREDLRQAAAALEELAPENQGLDVHMMLGRIHRTWAEYEKQKGQDPRPSVGKALEAFHRVLGMNESHMPARIGIASLHLLRALDSHGTEPDGDLEQARKMLEKARALNPNYVQAWFYEARVYTHLANRNKERREDARPWLKKAIELYKGALEINPKLPYLLYNVGLSLIDMAAAEWERGGDPFDPLDKAQEYFEKAIALAPRDARAHHNLGCAHAHRAEYLRLRGKEPGPSLDEARKSFEKAQELAPTLAFPWAGLGRIHHTQAAFESDQGRDPRGSLERATHVLQRALAIEPHDPDARSFLEKVHQLQKDWERRRQARAGNIR